MSKPNQCCGLPKMHHYNTCKNRSKYGFDAGTRPEITIADCIKFINEEIKYHQGNYHLAKKRRKMLRIIKGALSK